MSKLEIYSPFKVNLEELFFQWWSNSVVDQCEDMSEDDQLEWFLSEVKTVTKQIQTEMKSEEDF
jgi:hypothetical protein